jgi:predicted RND superfamily exporter protein
MGKVLGIVIGVVLVVLGVWGIVTWWSLFVRALMAAVPALMIVVGVVLVVFFVSEIRSSIREKAEMEGAKESVSEKEKTPKEGSKKAE